MFLKQLEMQGFKSFLKRSKIELEPGINAVIGPNGVGKSNIVDAVMWCLGEISSKALRGKKMEELIFGGSKNYQPVGRAEVSLLIDNSDNVLPLEFQEVAVTRRLFRSGESEYLINKVPNRLKDIQELFAGTGAGCNSINVIRQGKLEEILNSKPEEKRAFLEESSGLIKFRNRKTEALKKLEETERHLQRINDLIAELKGQLLVLEKEAGTAGLYRKYNAEWKELDLNLKIIKLRRIFGSLNKILGEKSALADNVYDAGQEQLFSRKRLKKLRSNIQQKNKQIAERQEDYENVEKRIEKINSAIAVSFEKKNIYEERQNTLNKEYYDKKQKIRFVRENLTAQEKNLEDLFGGLERLTAALKDLQAKDLKTRENCEAVKLKFKKAHQRLLNIENDINIINNSLTEEERMVQKLLSKREKICQDLINTQQRLQRAEDLISGQENNIRGLTKLIKKYHSKKESLLNRISEEEDRLKLQNEAWERKKMRVNFLSSRLNIMKQMAANYEGLGEGARIVLQEKDKGNPECSGVFEVVAEIILVHENYEKAIEVALGKAQGYIVTNTVEEARKAINLLKSRGRGRATFLPLELLKPRELRVEEAEVFNFPGFIGRASDLVTAKRAYLPVAQYLLGNVVVFKTLENALECGRKTGYNLKIVTLEGEVVNPGGLLTGGSVGRKDNSIGILGRSQKIKQLETRVKEQQRLVSEYKKLKDEVQRRTADLRERYTSCEKELKALEIKLEGEKEAASSGWEEKVKLDEAYQGLSFQLKEIEEEIDAGNLKIKEKMHLLSEKQQEKVQIHDEAEKLEKQVGKLEALLEKIGVQFSEAKLQHASYLQEKKFLEETIRKLKAEIKEQSFNLRNIEREKEELKNKIYLLEKDINNLKTKKLDADRERKYIKEITKKIKDEIGCLSKCCEKEEIFCNTADEETKRIGERIRQLELSETKLKLKSDLLVQNLSELYGISREEALTKQVIEQPAGKIKERMVVLKKEMDGLGSVNLGAITEYERLKRRFDFLMDQREDIFRARDSLVKVIQEIDTVLAERFSKSLNVIRNSFNEVFRNLFGGGEADLRLTEPGNLLESGVELVVRPPGKKLQNLSLLSGGEKTLTVIALLFSIINTGSSHFCILDEVDASLDEANVERFAKYLRRVSSKTQFIVVTHRQRTMEVADVLYGITMEEPGISKIISMDIRDIPEVC